MNKSLRKAVFVLAGAIGLSGFAFSQDAATQSEQTPAPPARMGHRHEMKGNAEGRLQRLSQELNLTEDQKAKLKPILHSEWQEMKPVHEDTALTPDQRHEKMKDIHEKYRAQIADVLTPEQHEKWKKMQADRMQHRGKMDKGGDAPQN
jgi:periplasmic protein CpxP/Spy